MSRFDPVGIDYDADQESECWCPDAFRTAFIPIPECPRHGDLYKVHDPLAQPIVPLPQVGPLLPNEDLPAQETQP